MIADTKCLPPRSYVTLLREKVINSEHFPCSMVLIFISLKVTKQVFLKGRLHDPFDFVLLHDMTNYFIQIMFSKREDSVLVVFESFHTISEPHLLG